MIDDNVAKAVAVVVFSLVILLGLAGVLWNKIQRGMGFGYRFIQVVAVLEIVPSVVILAILGVLNGETAAALIGAMAGYAFGLKSKEDSS